MTDQELNEINEKVARKLGEGWRTAYRQEHLPPYATDIAAAWEIVEYLKSKTLCGQLNIVPHESKVGFWIGDRHKQICFGDGDTAPLALCLAFLKLEEPK